MKVLFLGPFREEFGPEMALSLPQPITVRALLAILAARQSAFGPTADSRNDAELSGHLTVFKAGRMLKLDETLDDGDEIVLMLPATGG
jgi:molybdopterin converting factor small subunit